MQPPGPAESVWVSSISSSVPVRSHSSRSPSRKPGSGRTMPMLVRAGSVMTTATCSSARAASTDARSFHSTRPGGGGRIHRGTDVPGSRHRAAVGAAHHEGLVDGAVVAVGEARHEPAPGHQAGEAERPAVGVRRREGEGPARQPEARRQLVGHPRRVLGGEHGRDAAEVLHSVSHGRHGGRRRVTRHRTRVTEREVDVGVAVEVGDAAPRSLGEEDREAAGPLGHPGHRHAADQVGGGGGRRGGRPGASGREGGTLADQQLLQP